ncbi:MAG: 3-isopropylmalate dehydratase large subunit [Candidatus Coatesbacteria bacterium]|nr:MAG: 3-isopropylmalate dehydratase large subunit [Candidatus Coatesbacteria bacterium]
MPRTIIEHIIAAHADPGADIRPGAVVWLDLDVRSARDFGGANVVKNFRAHYEGENVADADKTFFTFDCNAPANTIAYANNQQICRDFAAEQGIRVFDVDAGIGSHVLMEQGLARPGGTVVGTDSHMNILGAVGCFGQGMGDTDIAFAFKTGRTWFEVPPTIRIDLKGAPYAGVSAKDVILYLIGEMGSAGALGCAVELYGKFIDAMEVDERITLASMGTEMGAIALLIPPNDATLEWVSKRAGEEVEPVYADAGADYMKTLEFDVEGLEPMIACPPSPENVKPVRAVEGTTIGSGFIGSCTNGRLNDMSITANILGGERVHSDVMLKVVPATREVWDEMMAGDVLRDIFDAGAIVSNAGCGGCAAGQIGMTGAGEVQLSTSNRNFAGKQGAGDTYLASPATVAVSALRGEITDPRG